jgi:hypothetical protein
MKHAQNHADLAASTTAVGPISLPVVTQTPGAVE